MATASSSAAGTRPLTATSAAVGRAPRIFLYAAVALILLTTVMRAAVCWRNDTWVEHPSGVLIAMAADLKDGIFYRPLYGPEGYGGTRYFPLYFVLQAGLLELGMPVLPSAYLVSGAAVLLLLVGALYLLRRLGAELWLAACGSATILAAVSAQMAVTNPHGDGLASALSVCGLAVVVRPNLSHRLVLVAAVLFALAWSAKLNMVFGVAAAVIWLLARGERRTAWELAGETALGCLLVAAVMMIASHGRVWEIFRACASGGTSLRLMRRSAKHVWAIANRADRGLVLFFFLAVFAFVCEAFTAPKKLLQNLPIVLLLMTLAVTIPIFGSPGVVQNHLIDVQIASVVLFTAWLAHTPSVLLKQLGVCALALVTMVATVPLLHKLMVWDVRFGPHRFQRVVAALPDTQKPILAENPIIPVLAGQRTYVLDAWMLRMLRDRIPNFADPLLERLRRGDFGAVVLSFADPRSPRALMWYTYSDFGPGFLEALTDNYRFAATVEDQMIFVPINDNYNPSPR